MLRIIRSLKSIRVFSKPFLSRAFSTQKHPLNQPPKPEQQLDPIQVQFINKLLRGEFNSSILSPEAEREQKLSFDLVNVSTPSQLLNKLKNHDDLSVNELFLFVFAYSNMKTLMNSEIQPYFKELIERCAELSPEYLLKFYQMIYPFRHQITLPAFPDLNDIPKEQVIELGYFLIKLYSHEPALKQLFDLISVEDIISQPLLYVEMLEEAPKDMRMQNGKNKQQWIDLVIKPGDAAKVILFYLKKNDTSLQSKVQKLNFKEIELQIVIDLLLECAINNYYPQKLSKYFSNIDLQSIEMSSQTYLNIWILMTKYRNTTIFSKTLQYLTKLKVPKELSVYDVFTVLMSAMVLQQKQFLIKNQSLLDENDMRELNENQIYALWKGAGKYQMHGMIMEIKKNVFNRKDLLQNKKQQILGK